MKRIIVGIIAIICSWIGWWLGDKFDIMSAFTLSMIGTGIGIYFGNRLIQI